MYEVVLGVDDLAMIERSRVRTWTGFVTDFPFPSGRLLLFDVCLLRASLNVTRHGACGVVRKRDVAREEGMIPIMWLWSSSKWSRCCEVVCAPP
jgi:hypothetical protein